MGYFLNVMQRIPMCILGKTVIYYDVVEEKEIEEEKRMLAGNYLQFFASLLLHHREDGRFHKKYNEFYMKLTS